MPFSAGMKKRTSEFVHPGLWHSHEDLETMRTNVLNGVEPSSSAYQTFANDSFSLSTYQMQGPKAVLSRGSITNITSFQSDARAAYQNALMCKFMQRINAFRQLTLHDQGILPKIKPTGTAAPRFSTLGDQISQTSLEPTARCSLDWTAIPLLMPPKSCAGKVAG